MERILVTGGGGFIGSHLARAGVAFGVWMLQIYAAEHHIVTNISSVSIAFILIGLFAVFTAVTLYAVSRLAKKTGNDR